MNNDKNIEVFRNAPVPKAVISNVIPSIISMIMILFYNLADAFFIGQTKDALMFAAVSLATPVFLIFMAVGMLFGIGGTSFIARSLGQGDFDKAKKISSFCFWTGTVVGVISLILVYINADTICWKVGASADTIGYTGQYLRIVAFGIPFLIISNIFSNVIRAEGHAKIAMMGIIVGNMVNIVFDPIMILGFKWNVAGAAIATVLGNVISAGFYLTHLLSKKTMLSIKPTDYRAGHGIATGVFAIGIPASLNSILMSVSNILINNVIKEYGDMAVAGLGVAMKINMIAVMLLIGLGSGVQPLLGYCFGAKMKKRYIDVLKFSLLLAVILSAIMTFICYTFAGPLVKAFLDNPDAFDYAFMFSRTYILAGPVIGILFVMINAIQSTGAMLPSLLLSISRQGILYLPILYIFTHAFHTERMAAMAQPVTDYCAAAMSIVLFIVTFKKLSRGFDSNLEQDC